MQTKFQTLLPWMDKILGSIKKDIKSDYLEENPIFRRKHFGNLPQNRITIEEISTAFTKEITEGNDELADWVIHRWVGKHGSLYHHFAQRLYAVNPEFDQIKELTREESERVLAGAKEAFGAKDVYIFSIFNAVVFPKEVLAQLLKEAQDE